MQELRWKSRRASDAVTLVYITLPPSPDGWEQCFLLRSDVHFDSAFADREMEERHLKEAAKLGAGILDFGDLFDAMQSPFDKRQSKSELREENKRGDYFNSLVDAAFERYRSYAKLFVLLSRGNHETKMISRAGVDLTAWLAARLRAETDSSVCAGGYTGWVRFMFDRSGYRSSRALWYTHGYGSGGEVTRNTIQLANRVPVYVETADIHVCGHTHNQWWMTYPRIRLNHRNEVETRDCHFIQLPTYKDEYQQGQGGWAVERGHSPRPLGAWWLIFRYTNKRGIEIDFRRAK